MTQDFAGVLHGPGHPDAGTPVRAAFTGELLQVEGGAGVESARLSVHAGGFNHDEVVLGWEEPAGHFALMVIEPQAKQALLACAPAVLQPRLKRWRRSVSFTRNLWRTVIVAASVAALTISLGFWQHQRVVRWTADRVSPENERRLGQSTMSSIRKQGRLVEQGKALDAIREIGARLTKDSTRQYEWHLVDDPGINAFALPGGFIVVNAGLVHATDSPDELAGVLAHEVQHVEQRHTLQLLIYQLGWATLLAVAAGDVSTLTTVLLLQVGNLKFSRDLEEQADAGGLETLRKAGVPLEGMASFFRKMQKDGGSGGLAWLSTHPSTDERIAAIEAAAKAQPCDACRPLELDWKALRESLYEDDLIRRPGQKKARK